MPSPYYFSKARKNTSAGANRLQILLASIAVLCGGLLCASIVFLTARYLMSTTQDTATSELAFACGQAMAEAGVRDRGGCRCIARAAIDDASINGKRLQELQRYFQHIVENPASLKGRPPSTIQFSREVGLVYGHPFLRAYVGCAREGFVTAETAHAP